MIQVWPTTRFEGALHSMSSELPDVSENYFQRSTMGETTHLLSVTEKQKKVRTFFGENTPTVSPSSLTATPISAKTASR